MNRKGKPALAATLVLLLVLAGACGTRQPDVTLIPTKDLPGSILVVPVTIAQDPQGTRDETTWQELEKGREVLAELVAEFLIDRPHLRFATTAQLIEVIPDYNGDPQAVASAAGRLGSDAALVITLHRYQERQGGPYAVAAPASAAFEFRLIASADLQVLCSGRFDETQKALSENVLDFFTAARRKFRWLKVEELLRDGLRTKLETCPALQEPGPAQR
jgi:hypothetical protein